MSSTVTGLTDQLFDPFVSNWAGEPYSAYRVLRDRHPVFHCVSRDVFVISRFADVQAATRDWEAFSNIPSSDLDDTGSTLGPGNFIDTDPPEHTRVRNVIRKVFSPKDLVQRLEARVRAEVDDLAAKFLERGEADLADEVAWPLPVGITSVLIGFPKEDRSTLRGLFQDLARSERGSPQVPAVARDAAESLGQYLAEVADERRRRPRDDLMSLLVAAEREGTLARDEVTGVSRLLCLAGSETTASSISNALWLLAQHPDQRAILDVPAHIPAAVEELLRYESPIQYTARSTTRRVEVAGRIIDKGARVVLLWGSANRDERRYRAAATLDITRSALRHVAFADGIHHCLGAPLARLETRVVLERLLPLLGDYQISGPVRRNPSHAVRGLSVLPVSFQPTRPPTPGDARP